MLHEGAETFLALLPFFHAFGLTFNVLSAVHEAATQVLLPQFDVDQVLAAHRRPTGVGPLRYADGAGGGWPL